LCTFFFADHGLGKISAGTRVWLWGWPAKGAQHAWGTPGIRLPGPVMSDKTFSSKDLRDGKQLVYKFS